MEVINVARKTRIFRGLICICIGVTIIAGLCNAYQSSTQTKPSNDLTAKKSGAKHGVHNHYQYSTDVITVPLNQHIELATTKWRTIFQPVIITYAFQFHELPLDSASKQCDHMVNSDVRSPCKLTGERVMNVIERMITDQCKLEVTTIACLNRNGLLYPEILPRNCPAKAPAAGEYLGCFSDNFTSRLLGEPYDLSDNTPQRCINHCLQHGFPLSGVEYGRECFCGDATPNIKILLPETACDMPCVGDANQSCGGKLAIKMYRTGIAKLCKREIIKTSSIMSNLSGHRVKVLYLLTLSGRSVRQVNRLFKALYHSTETYFIIHVDSRQDYMFRELLPLEERFPNVRLSRYRRPIFWGAITFLDVLLHCMEEALSLVDWHWDYLINLSEADFPIKTHETLITFLTMNNGLNFLGHRSDDFHSFIQQQGLFQIFYQCENKLWDIGDRKLPSGIEFDVSSDSMILTRSFIQYAVHNVSELVVGLKRVYKHTLLPAESFFQALLANSEFCETSTHDNLRHINWKRERCGHKHEHPLDWSDCYPSAFTLEDWPEILAASSSNALFARQFLPIINQNVLNYLDVWLYGEQPGLPGWNSYWENEFHADIARPPVESAFYTVYESLSRLSVKRLNSLTSGNCNVTAKINRVLEAALYMNEDVFKGTLVLFEVAGEFGSEMMVLETQARPKYFYEVIRLSEAVGRLKSIEVGSHYSKTDFVFRNLGRIFGLHSIIGAMHKWFIGDPLNITFVWIDPANTIASSTEVAIPAGIYTGFQELSVAQPLRPGTWTLILLHGMENVVAQMHFLVVPLSHNGLSPISAQEAKVANGGLADKIHYTNANFSSFEKMFSIDDQDKAKSQLLEARQNGQLFGVELIDWIDGLVENFYDVQDVCYVKTPLSLKLPSCILDAMAPCRLVSWSSRSTDPKSFLGNVNKFTGLLER